MYRIMGVAAAALLIAGSAAAQTAPNPDLRPLHGEIHLRAGFSPDPHDVRVDTSGQVPARNARAGCAGYVTTAPTIRVNWTAGTGILPLFFTTTDYGRDPVILVRDPNGAWHCDDDGGIGLNPLFEAQNTLSGPYDVWVGSWSDSSSPASLTFRVTELTAIARGSERRSDPPSLTSTPRAALTGAPPNDRLPPRFGVVSLSGGFLPDPHEIRVTAGGNMRARDFSSGCVGYINEAPTTRLEWSTESSALPLLIAADSGADTTLVVRAPDGAWYCDDDSAGGLNPLFAATSPQSGRYDIWVGRYSQGTAEATLRISELIGNMASSENWTDEDEEYCESVNWRDPYCDW